MLVSLPAFFDFVTFLLRWWCLPVAIYCSGTPHDSSAEACVCGRSLDLRPFPKRGISNRGVLHTGCYGLAKNKVWKRGSYKTHSVYLFGEYASILMIVKRWISSENAVLSCVHFMFHSGGLVLKFGHSKPGPCVSSLSHSVTMSWVGKVALSPKPCHNLLAFIVKFRGMERNDGEGGYQNS